MSSRQHGVTLIELMIALVILGILVMAALPSYTAWIQNTKIRGTTEAVLNGLQLARAEAVRRNTNVTFALAAGPTSDWTVSAVAPSVPEVIQTRSAAHGSANVTVAPSVAGAANNAATTVTFNSLGRVLAVNANGTTPFDRIDFNVPTNILPANLSRDLAIRVSAGGNIKMCDPTVTDANDPAKTDSRRC